VTHESVWTGIDEVGALDGSWNGDTVQPC
jgi:hypothetical protein